MERVPMDLEQAELLARTGNAGRVSSALWVEIERLRAADARVRALCAAAKAGGRVGVIRVDHILDALDAKGGA